MKQNTYVPIGHEQLTSTSTTDVHTASIPNGASGVLIGVETNAARVGFDGTTPSSSAGQVYPSGVAPVFVPVGPGTVLKVASTGAANSVVNLTYMQ